MQGFLAAQTKKLCNFGIMQDYNERKNQKCDHILENGELLKILELLAKIGEREGIHLIYVSVLIFVSILQFLLFHRFYSQKLKVVNKKSFECGGAGGVSRGIKGPK